MLSGDVAETSRPRPPAKVQRSAPLPLLRAASSPPSSYVTAAFNHSQAGQGSVKGLLGSPLLATSHWVGWPKMKDQLSPSTEEDQEWINEKSREELSELLVKAEGVIRERENDLGMASAVVKSLYENTVALKTKHEALFKRLPTSPLPSLSPELPAQGSRYGISLNRPVSGIFECESSPPVAKSQAARKISFSAAEILRLADQNAEFLEKLERMEAECVQADQTSRRKLKRLEKEILCLREELEKTQAKSEELEEKQKAAFGWDAEKMLQDSLKKREEREVKIKALRAASQGNVDSGSSEVKDFAPGGSALGYLHLPPRHPSTLDRPRPGPAQLPLSEQTLISRLFAKIEELEWTNNQILEQQTATNNQLNAIQRETEHVTKIYECFAEEVIEVAPDIDSEEGREPDTDETIRFYNLKRNLAAQSTPRQNQSPRTLNFATASPACNFVMGLFSPVDHDPRESPSSRYSPFSDSFVSPQTGTIHSSWSIGSTSLASPAFPTHSITSSRSQPSNLGSSGVLTDGECEAAVFRQVDW